MSKWRFRSKQDFRSGSSKPRCGPSKQNFASDNQPEPFRLRVTDDDLVNYARTITAKVRVNDRVMTQIANNTRAQAMLGDFQKAIEDAILDSNEAHQKQMMKLLSMPENESAFASIIYDMLNVGR